MDEYYTAQNATDIKRRPELAKQALRELNEKPAVEILEFCTSHKIIDLSVTKRTEEFEAETTQ